MGQYMKFYVKSNSGEMLPLRSFAETSWGYSFGKEAVKISNTMQALTRQDVQTIITTVNDAFIVTAKSIKENRDKLAYYANLENEKENILSILSTLNQEGQDKIEISLVLGFFTSLEYMFTESDAAGYDSDNYIYATVVEVE